MGLACSSRYNIEDTTEAQKQQRVISLRQKYLSNLAAEKLVELQKPEIGQQESLCGPVQVINRSGRK